MSRIAAFLLCLLAVPAAAQQINNLPTPGSIGGMDISASNAVLPTALSNLTGGIVTQSGSGPLLFGSGSTTITYGTNGTPTIASMAVGSAASPTAAAGSVLGLFYHGAVLKASCNNNSANTGCNSPLLINAVGDPASTMVTSGATIYAETTSTAVSSDGQALNAIGRVSGSGIGIGTGAYIEGGRTTNTGKSLAAEFRNKNDTSTDGTVSTTTIGTADGLWITPSSTGGAIKSSSALHVGSSGDSAVWKEAFTINAAVSDNSINDASSSTTSLNISGTHTNAIASAQTAGLFGFGTAAPAARAHIAGAFSSPAWTVSGALLRVDSPIITDTTSSGTVANVYNSVIQGGTIAASSATTYTNAYGLYVSAPAAGTNVTLTNALSLRAGAGIRGDTTFQLGAGSTMTLAAGEMGLAKITASGTAPGAGGIKVATVCGTNAGTAKLIAYGGTSTTPATILDNIGSGVTGC